MPGQGRLGPGGRVSPVWRRPGRLRRIAHILVGVLGWIALAALLVWRLPDRPPWRLPLPVGVSILVFAVALVLLALLWARIADRRRTHRPGPLAPPEPLVEEPDTISARG
jgi:hypothetical protein